MSLPSKYGIDKNINSMAGLSAYENGGKGSGNFGHSGRPGERGGSGSGQGSMKMPERAEDSHDWFKSVKEVQDDYKARKDEIEKNADEIYQKIFETGESYIGPKKKVIDFLKQNIKIYADEYPNADDFLEQASDLLDDYKFAKEAKSKKLEIFEHPMSGSGVVVREYKDNK